MIYDLPIIMLTCLLLTIVFECIGALILKVKNIKDYLNIILVNILTNPLLVSLTTFLNIRYGILGKTISTIILEILVVIVEGHIYKKVLKYERISPYILSIILNGCSYLLGLLINYFDSVKSFMKN